MRLNTLLRASAATAILLTGFAFAAPATQPVKPYPLKTCVVSGDTLGEMGEPIVKQFEGREIKFCCSGCVGAFDKNPEKYIKKIENAEKKPTTKPS